MALLLILIALELGALLYVAYGIWNLLETKIWNNTATIDGNISDATSAICDIRDAIAPVPRHELGQAADEDRLRQLARLINKMPKGSLSDEEFARLTVDALNKGVKSNDSE